MHTCGTRLWHPIGAARRIDPSGVAFALRTPMRAFSRSDLVRRALAVFERRRGEPITIRDLCRAAGVCERTLRNAFQRVHGVSPKQYLIRYRLEAAHDALLRARGERGAVTRVATDYGFLELGRFAGAYRDMFGVRPSDTLRATLRSTQS